MASEREARIEALPQKVQQWLRTHQGKTYRDNGATSAVIAYLTAPSVAPASAGRAIEELEKLLADYDGPVAEGARLRCLVADRIAALRAEPSPEPDGDGRIDYAHESWSSSVAARKAIEDALAKGDRRTSELDDDQLDLLGEMVDGLMQPSPEPGGCEFCGAEFPTHKGKADTDGHGLGECVPICPTCNGSGSADEPSPEPQRREGDDVLRKFLDDYEKRPATGVNLASADTVAVLVKRALEGR